MRVGNDKTIINRNVELAGSLTLFNNGEANHIKVAGGHFFTTYPMVMNAGQGKFLVRSNSICIFWVWHTLDVIHLIYNNH